MDLIPITVYTLIPIRWRINSRTNRSGSSIGSSSLDMLIMNKFVGEFRLSLANANCIRMSVDWVNLLEMYIVTINRYWQFQCYNTLVNSITLPAAAVANEIEISSKTKPTIIPPDVPSNWLRAVDLFNVYKEKLFLNIFFLEIFLPVMKPQYPESGIPIVWMISIIIWKKKMKKNTMKLKLESLRNAL